MKRRDVLKGLSAMAALSAWPARDLWAAAVESTYKGVKLGLITGTLNPLPNVPGKDPIDVIIESCLAVGAANIELVNVGGTMPPAVINGGRFGQAPDQKTPEYLTSREALRQFRINLPLDRFREVRKKFDDAGLNLFSSVYTIDDDMTDPEIDAVFRQMQALKVGLFCTNQTRVTMAARMVPFAEKYKIKPAWHPHDNIDSPVEVATAETLEKLLAMSKNFAVNFDIGHFTAGNGDAVAFLKKHHDRITHLHVKDRKRNHGPNVQLGEGDTPIKECLALIRDNKWPIYALLEREYRGPGTPVEEARWQMDYMKKALDATT
jgi:sugar phosphate isomerase/epimerase